MVKSVIFSPVVNEVSEAHNTCPFTIDLRDSVNLNLSEATIINNTITIPIYIESDDDINSLDLSVVFDTVKLTYQSIIDHTGHIQYTDFYNPMDQTLRFTSNSFTLYDTNKKIISIRFKLKSSCIETKDFFSMISYLNGDLCSSKIPEYKIYDTTSTIDNNESKVKMFPNPASEHLFIISSEDASISLITSSGEVVKKKERLQANRLFTLDTEDFPSGTYYLHFVSKQKNTYKTVIIKNE